MDKNIKYLIENIVNFNPYDYQEDENDVVNNQTVERTMYKYFPKDKNELKTIIQQCIAENKFGNKKIIFPDLSGIDVTEITDMSNLFKDIFRPSVVSYEGSGLSESENIVDGSNYNDRYVPLIVPSFPYPEES